MAMRWIRLYTEIVDDPRIQRMSPETFRFLVNLWCVAGMNEGAIPPVPDVAFRLRLDEEDCNRRMHELCKIGLVDVDEAGALSPHNWKERQYASDHDAVHRKRRSRMSQRCHGEMAVTVTTLSQPNGRDSHNDVTASGCDMSQPCHGDVTASDSDSEQTQNRLRTERGLLEIDHAAEFAKRWERWPGPGRTREPLCQQIWCELFAHLSPEESVGLMEKIDEGLDRWLASDNFARGYVHAFADFLKQRRWGERPKRSAAAPSNSQPMLTEQAPPLECGCGELGCAICRLIKKAS